MKRINPLRLLVGLLALVAAAPPAAYAASPDELTTIAEQSAFKRTGRYDEVERLCAAFAARWPDQARCFEFGRSPENRPLLALAVSEEGVLDPETVRARRRPVVLFQGGIHAGEIDGKDAGFIALRDMLEGRESRGALSRTTVLFVPVFNVDGHERFGAWNRPNQRGPEEMGWRATAQNLNLNRDYTKADAPEMRAMLALLNEWDPILYTDLHVTDGAELREDLSVEVEPGQGWDLELGRTGHALRDEVLARLQRKGFHALPFYPEFVGADDPASGVAADVRSPRFSLSYWATRNRFGALVETHSWQEYPRRIAATRETIHAMVELAARDGVKWLEAAHAADERAQQLGGKPVALSFKNTDAVQTVDLRGYEYTREASAVSGQDMDTLRLHQAHCLAAAVQVRGAACADRDCADHWLCRAECARRVDVGKAGPARHRVSARDRSAAGQRRADFPRRQSDGSGRNLRGKTGHDGRRRVAGGAT